MKKILVSIAFVVALGFAASSYAIAFLYPLGLVLGNSAIALYTDAMMVSVLLHTGVLSLVFDSVYSATSIPGSTPPSPSASPPIIVYANITQPLLTPAGWTPATGASVSQGGNDYGPNEPIPPVVPVVSGGSPGTITFHASYTSSVSPYALISVDGSSPSSVCNSWISAVNADYQSANPALGSNYLSFESMPSDTLCSSKRTSTGAHFYTVAISSTSTPGTSAECPSGTSINPDGVTCSPAKPADGTSEYYVDVNGNFVRDPKDGDPAVSVASISGKQFKISNDDGSSTTFTVFSTDGLGKVAEASIKVEIFDGSGVVKRVKTLFLGQCSDTFPDWHLCVTSAADSLSNSAAGASSTTTFSSDGAGGVATTNSTVGDQTALIVSGSSGFGDGGSGGGGSGAGTGMGNCPGCATEFTLKGISDYLQAGIESMVGIADEPLGTKEINVASIVPVSVGGAGSCPAPHAMSIGGHTYYKSYVTECNFANGVHPIIIAAAWLAAAGLLIGGFKNA